MRIVLASASPRRRDLLHEAQLVFDVVVSHAVESVDPSWTPEAAAVAIAQRKARAVADELDEPALVIGADTVVAVDVDGAPLLLEKPVDAADARRMLDLLSGSRHRVITGVCVVRRPDGAERSDFERTWVSMRELSAAERAAYVASGEWRDKAGGYAIQENADAFVTSLEEGGFDNVVGLPVALTERLLAELDAG